MIPTWKTHAPRAVLLLSAALVLGGTGCSVLPKAAEDPTRYYVLASTTAGSAVPSAEAPVVFVRPVEIASYLRGRPLIVRRGDNEIEFRDYARWGEPLEQGIGRVLREELIARGAAGAVVSTATRRDRPSATVEVTVRVLSAEGSADGKVEFRAAWEVTKLSASRSTSVGSGQYQATDLKWDGKSESSLAAQLSSAVSALGGEIATAVRK